MYLDNRNTCIWMQQNKKIDEKERDDFTVMLISCSIKVIYTCVYIQVYRYVYNKHRYIFIYIFFPRTEVFLLVKTWHVTAVYISMADRWKFLSGKYGQCMISFSIMIITSCICQTKCGPHENKTLTRFVTIYRNILGWLFS